MLNQSTPLTINNENLSKFTKDLILCAYKIDRNEDILLRVLDISTLKCHCINLGIKTEELEDSELSDYENLVFVRKEYYEAKEPTYVLHMFAFLNPIQKYLAVSETGKFYVGTMNKLKNFCTENGILLKTSRPTLTLQPDPGLFKILHSAEWMDIDADKKEEIHLATGIYTEESNIVHEPAFKSVKTPVQSISNTIVNNSNSVNNTRRDIRDWSIVTEKIENNDIYWSYKAYKNYTDECIRKIRLANENHSEIISKLQYKESLFIHLWLASRIASHRFNYNDYIRAVEKAEELKRENKDVCNCMFKTIITQLTDHAHIDTTCKDMNLSFKCTDKEGESSYVDSCILQYAVYNAIKIWIWQICGYEGSYEDYYEDYSDDEGVSAIKHIAVVCERYLKFLLHNMKIKANDISDNIDITNMNNAKSFIVTVVIINRIMFGVDHHKDWDEDLIRTCNEVAKLMWSKF